MPLPSSCQPESRKLVGHHFGHLVEVAADDRWRKLRAACRSGVLKPSENAAYAVETISRAWSPRPWVTRSGAALRAARSSSDLAPWLRASSSARVKHSSAS